MPYDPQAASVPRNPIIPLPDAPIEYPVDDPEEAVEEEEVLEPAIPGGEPESPIPGAPLAPGI
jgi:hypothetical protein